MHIRVTKGLSIPIQGQPKVKLDNFGIIDSLPISKLISLNLSPFENIQFSLLSKTGDAVKIGQPLAADKACPARIFVSPAAGVIKEIRRGHKRRLLDIIIEVAEHEEFYPFSLKDLSNATREDILEFLLAGGMFTHIRQRPFNLLADPTKIPRSIFIKALETAPFVPSAEMQVVGYEKEFEAGLQALTLLTTGNVHLVYKQNTTCQAFLQAKNIQHHTVEGPHPSANHSLHIQMIDPIHSPEDVIWTVTAHDVVLIGHLLTQSRYLTHRIVSIGGPGIIEEKTGYFHGREGMSISTLVADRVHKGLMRLISGDVLTGSKIEADDFLGFNHYTFCVIPEGISREFLHFFRLGIDKYSFSKAYLSGHLDNSHRDYFFNTSQHGEERAFIDSTLYDEVMPMRIPTMHLVKAIMAEDYDLAKELGLLEVDAEDFALSTFVDPSKIEMMEIVKQGLKNYAADVLL